VREWLHGPESLIYNAPKEHARDDQFILRLTVEAQPISIYHDGWARPEEQNVSLGKRIDETVKYRTKLQLKCSRLNKIQIQAQTCIYLITLKLKKHNPPPSPPPSQNNNNNGFFFFLQGFYTLLVCNVVPGASSMQRQNPKTCLKRTKKSRKRKGRGSSIFVN